MCVFSPKKDGPRDREHDKKNAKKFRCSNVYVMCRFHIFDSSTFRFSHSLVRSVARSFICSLSALSKPSKCTYKCVFAHTTHLKFELFTSHTSFFAAPAIRRIYDFYLTASCTNLFGFFRRFVLFCLVFF